MTHKTSEIELNDREKKALENITSFMINVNIGTGVRHKMELKGDIARSELRSKTESMAHEVKRGAVIYATGKDSIMDVPVLVATFIPKGAYGTWKLAEGFSLD